MLETRKVPRSIDRSGGLLQLLHAAAAVEAAAVLATTDSESAGDGQGSCS